MRFSFGNTVAVPAYLGAVFSHRNQEFECVKRNWICCLKKRLVPKNKHIRAQCLAVVL